MPIHHFLTLFAASILAPLSSSLSTTFERPLRMAMRRGVFPSYSNDDGYDILQSNRSFDNSIHQSLIRKYLAVLMMHKVRL